MNREEEAAHVGWGGYGGPLLAPLHALEILL